MIATTMDHPRKFYLKPKSSLLMLQSTEAHGKPNSPSKRGSTTKSDTVVATDSSPWSTKTPKNSRNRIVPSQRVSIGNLHPTRHQGFYESVNNSNMNSAFSLSSRSSRKKSLLRRVSSLGNVFGMVKRFVRRASFTSKVSSVRSGLVQCPEVQYKLIKFELTLEGKRSIGFDVFRDESCYFYVNQIDANCSPEVAANVRIADILMRVNGRHLFDMSTGQVLKLLNGVSGRTCLELRRIKPNKISAVAVKSVETSTFGLHVVRGMGDVSPFDPSWYVMYCNPDNVSSEWHPQQYDQLTEINYTSVEGMTEEDVRRVLQGNDFLLLTLLRNQLVSHIMRPDQVAEVMHESVRAKDFVVERRVMSITPACNPPPRSTQTKFASMSRCFDLGLENFVEAREVLLERRGTDVGFHLECVGGALFVSEVAEDRAIGGNVCVGDKVVSVNSINVESMGEQSCIQLLSCSRSPLRLILSYRFEDYITFAQSHFARDRGFFLKAFFDYTPGDPSHRPIAYGDVLNVVRRADKDWWVVRGDKLVPSYGRAQQIRHSTLINTLNYAGADGVFLRDDLQSESYCLVEKRTVSLPRPVVIVGFCSDLVANHLLSNMARQFYVSRYDTTDCGVAEVSAEVFNPVSEQQYKMNLKQDCYVDSQFLNGFYYGLPISDLVGQTRSPVFVNPRRQFLDSLVRRKIFPIVIVIKPGCSQQSEDVANEHHRVSIMQNELGFHVTACIEHLTAPEDIFTAVISLILDHGKAEVFVPVGQLVWF